MSGRGGALATAVVIAFAAATAALASPDEAVAPSEEVRGLASSGGACPFDQLSIFHLQVQPVPPSPERQFSDCGYVEYGGLRIERFEHLGPHGLYRLEYVKRLGGTPNRYIIYLSGGPRSMTTGIGPAPFRAQLPVGLAEQEGTGVLAPAYLGTWTRSLYPRPDTEAAAEEVARLIDRLRWLQPQAEVSLVAVSAGTLVAIRVLARRSLPTVFAIPSPTSLRDLVEDPLDANDFSDARMQLVRFYRYRPGTQELDEVTATAEEEVSAFAGEDYDKSLVDLIAALPPHRRDCIAIVYGTEDRRVRNERLVDVRRRFPSIQISGIAGMGHGPATERQAEALARTVADTMPDRCS